MKFLKYCTYLMPNNSNSINLGLYIAPTNGEYVGSSFNLKPKDKDKPNEYKPSVEEKDNKWTYNGANWFDDDTQLLYVLIKGSDPIELKVQPVIQVNYYVNHFVPQPNNNIRIAEHYFGFEKSVCNEI